MCLLSVALLGVAYGADATQPKAYQPETTVAGEIRIWGTQAMSPVVAAWSQGFKRHHPSATVTSKMLGTGTATPGLYTGQADIALLGREPIITDINGFGRVKQYAPLRLELTGGSLATPGQSSALAAFVHQRNPIERVSLEQLAALFGCDPPAGRSAIRRWGDLGLEGAWARRRVNVYSFDFETGTGRFFQRAALHGNMKLHWESIREYRDIRREDGTVLRSAAAQILAALSRDPAGLAIAHSGYGAANVKPLLLATRTDGNYVALTAETLMSGEYPLGRRTYALVDRPPGTALKPSLREFLRYALSADGQAEVARLQGYLPLGAAQIAEQLSNLN
jgi:phosphate transport system substrate-binding protein